MLFLASCQLPHPETLPKLENHIVGKGNPTRRNEKAINFSNGLKIIFVWSFSISVLKFL